MILQQRRFLPPKTSRNILSLLLRQHNPIETLIQHMIIMESTRILRQRIQLPPQRTPSPSINAMAVRSTHHIRPGLVNGGMNHVRGGVEQTVLAAVDYFAGMVDED
jgi:hypothetical protein